MCGLQNRRGAADAESGQILGVAGRLETPREVYDRVGALDDLRQALRGIGFGEVQFLPLDVSIDTLGFGWTAHDADDVPLRCFVGEQAQQRGADVAGRAGDDDAHGVTPSRRDCPGPAASRRSMPNDRVYAR